MGDKTLSPVFRITFTPAKGSQKGKKIQRTFVNKDNYSAYESCMSLFPNAVVHEIKKGR